MSKKMKGVALYSSSYDRVDVAKARFKHQSLIQDYQELKREADAMKNKLETMKLRKLNLSAEVRFLQRRYQYLSKNKAAKPPQGHELVQKQNFQTQSKKLRKIAPTHDVNKNEKIYGAKEYAHGNPSPVLELSKKTSLRYRTPVAFDLNQKERAYGGKQAALQNPTPTLDLNKRGGLYSGKETTPRDPPRTFDLNQTERPYIGRKNGEQNRAPVFDLNQISGEEESRDIYEPLRVEKSTKKSIGGGADEQVNNLSSVVCRSLGNGRNRVGKRKISWQDQVALKV